MCALTLTLLLAVNALADTSGTTTEPQLADLLLWEAIVIVAIAIPNLLKSRQG